MTPSLVYHVNAIEDAEVFLPEFLKRQLGVICHLETLSEKGLGVEFLEIRYDLLVHRLE